MLDHVFTDAITALRDAFDKALLERQAFEEHFRVDVLLGDVTWETTYGLPGEGWPPRVQADLTLEWPTWSQTAYRRWYIEGTLDEHPAIDIEVVLRLQRLADRPEPDVVVGVLPELSPAIGAEPLERFGPAIEVVYGRAAEQPEYAAEVSYEGVYELAEEVLADGSSTTLDDHFAALGAWIVSMLVRLGDLKLEFLPPEDEDAPGR